MRRRCGIKNRIISLALILVILATSLYGCGSKQANDLPAPESPKIDTEELVHDIVEEIQEDIEEDSTSQDSLKPEDIVLSENWEDYLGDVETFVYGLLTNELGYKYDTFPACVELSDGSEIFGIGYTDYQDCYSNEEGTECTFLAGMIPYYGEYAIPEEDFDDGLQIQNVEYEDESTSFLLAYESDPFTEHCVAYSQYIKYGVDDNGVIFYENSDYKEDEIDKSIGSLYSFDEQKYLYDVDFGNKIDITGQSLSEQIDYEEVEREINKVLEQQDINFASVDIKSYAYASKDAITNYFLQMQEETFLGYQVSSLIEMSKQLDPMECIRITDDGLEVINIEEPPKEGEEALVKWLVGTGCVLLTAVGMVGSVVFIECPPLSALSGAIAGVAIEVFMQVVISNQTLDEINWTRVAIAAATGAVAGFLGPYVMASFEGATYFVVDSALDGLIGGIEYTIYAWMDGGSGVELAKQFGVGFALGFGLSAAFKGVGAVIGKIGRKIGPALGKAGEKVFPKLSAKVSKAASKAGKALFKLKEVADGTIFHSKYISNKLAWRQLSRILSEGDDKLVKKAFDALGVDDIYDSNGNLIDKNTLRTIFDKADNDSIIGYFKFDGEIVNIKKQNGIVGIVFNDKYPTVSVVNRLKANRATNFEEAAAEFKKIWIKDDSTMPESIKNAISAKGKDINTIEPDELSIIIQKSDWTMHENIDMKTITLVPSKIHSALKHMGGYGLAKYLKFNMGREFFDRFVSQAASTAVAGF